MSYRDSAGSSVKQSHLFMVRLWLENTDSEKPEWRGKVQHVSSGEARYFRDWSTLENFMETLLFLNNSDDKTLVETERNDG